MGGPTDTVGHSGNPPLGHVGLVWGWKPICISLRFQHCNSCTGFYYQFDNLRFITSQNFNDVSAACVAVCFVSSKVLKCRLLK